MVKNNIIVEDAVLRFRNFSGKEGKFNPEGRRNFCVLLDHETGTTLKEEGWNIRWLDPKDPDDDPQAYLQVAVAFNEDPNKNPKMVLISSRGKTMLNEDTIGMLDWAEFERVDITIRPYNWTASGNSGVKAYVKALYATIKEDDLDLRYSNLPDSASDVIGGCGNCETCDGGCNQNTHL